MTNPFEDALHFLLHDRMNKGDGPSGSQAEKHVQAIDAYKKGLKEPVKDAAEPAKPAAEPAKAASGAQPAPVIVPPAAPAPKPA